MTDDKLRAAQMAVFERWFGPPSDGMSAATRRAIADELAALAASATDEGPRPYVTPTLGSLSTRTGSGGVGRSAVPEALDDRKRLRTALADVLRVFDAPFATSPTTRANIRRRAVAALAASATDEPVTDDEQELLLRYRQTLPDVCLRDSHHRCLAASATDEPWTDPKG